MTLLGTESEQDLVMTPQTPKPNGEPPAPKRAKGAGRKPHPDEPCEHGPSVKTCQKCIYRKRVEKAIVNHDHRGSFLKIILMWSQNLVYFGSLASLLVLPRKDPGGYDRVCAVVDARVGQFSKYQSVEMKMLKEVKEEVFMELTNTAFETMGLASPPSVETVYVAKWLLEREYKEEMGGLKALIGDFCFSFTEKIASLWEDSMICPGISDAVLVDHFKFWKGPVWKNREGVYGVRQPGEPNIRSIHCTGFTAEGLCDRCSIVRRHLMKERSAYKIEPPGINLLVKSLPPGYRDILYKIRLPIPDDHSLLGPSDEVDDDDLPPPDEPLDG